MSTQRFSAEFTLGGLPVRLTLAGERWVARVGESVAVGSGARQVLTAALESFGVARTRALLADLVLRGPSLDLARWARPRPVG